MRLYRDLRALPAELEAGAVTIGNFDGVHQGHARIVQALIERARAVSGPAVVFTFEPHPVRLLRPDAAPPPLTWTERKAQLLAELGVDAIIAYPTDLALLRLLPAEFFQQIVVQHLQARAIVEGPNFFFGRNRTGDVRLLEQFCRESGVQLEIVQPLQHGPGYVSSSRVRALVAQGDVAGARELLTSPYRIRGMVTHGAGRGAQLGYPTANVEAIDTLLPALGVYAGEALAQGSVWKTAVNIGPNPTFHERVLKVEAHLIDFEAALYGEPLEIDFLARLRDIQPFDSVESLKRQLAADVDAARRLE